MSAGLVVIVALPVLSAILAAYYVTTLARYRSHAEDVGTAHWRASVRHVDGYAGRHRVA